MKTRLFVLSSIFFTLLLPLVVCAEDDLNDIAYQNRFLLKAGTILNSEGKGDCLIFPYYDVRKNDGEKQTTDLNIVNFGEYGIAAKLRFREWARGREVFSKDIWIPSAGVWSGKIEMTEDGTNAVISSPGNVIWRSDANAFYFSNPLSGGALLSKKGLRKNKGDSPLFGYIEVIGEEKTSPEVTDGKVERLAKSEQDCPNTLRGDLAIDRIGEGVSMTYDAVAIGNFSRGQGSLFRSAGSPYPRLDNCEDTIDQLDFQLSKWEVFGPFAVSPSNQGKTSVILTFPTKQFHYKGGKRIKQINNPFLAQRETQGETLQTALSQGGQQLPADSVITLPYSVNVIGLYRDYYGEPVGIDNVPLRTFSYESDEVTLTADNIAQRVLIEDYEYLHERFSMYRGLPAVALVLREFRNPDVLHGSIIPAEFSAIWEASDAEFVTTPAAPAGPVSGQAGLSYSFATGGSFSSLFHNVQYQIDWGDGTSSVWLDPDPATGNATSSHVWTAQGSFTIRARARCASHPNIISSWSSGVTVTMAVETISTPFVPSGPSSGVVNNDDTYPFDKNYSFTTGGSLSSLGHPVQYQIDWGDGTDSGWLPVGTISASKRWDTGGVFTVKARARCNDHPDFISNWSNGLAITIESVSPPNTLSGTTSGLPNIPYTYTTGGALSNLSGHPVQYFFDWGDGTNSGWLPVGITTATKAFPLGNATNKGVYSVKSRARCATDTLAVSLWTSELKVTMEWVSTPTKPVSSGPNDPEAGQPGETFTFVTGGAFSNVNHAVEYQFDWNGDGASDLSPWGPATRSKVYATGGTFSVKARARCVTDTSIVSDWSAGLSVKIEQVTVTTPVGPTTVVVGSFTSNYTATGSSNIGHPVQIRFFSSDGGDSGWLAAPGGSASFPKTWSSPGTFSVTAKARCATHPSNESPLSAPLVVTVSNPAPTLTSILPTSGNRLETLNVVLTGTNFINGVTTVDFGTAITLNSSTVSSATQITANITISADAATGPRPVSVTNPGAAPASISFTVNNPAPTLTGILPASGTLGQTLDVVLTGTNFIGGVSSVSFGAVDITVNSITVGGPTQMTANITILGTATLGPRNVSVTNPLPGGGLAPLLSGFTVN